MRKGADIQRRAFDFGCRIVSLHDTLVTRGPSARELGRQVLRSGTSIGANLEEGDAAHSRAEFISKCCISLKEARETHYWLRVLAATSKVGAADGAEELLRECNELISILTTIVRKTRGE